MATLETLISAEQISARISDLGKLIAEDYPDGDLVLLCILKGAWIFHGDLARAIPRKTTIEFMGISSYGAGKTSSGQVKVTKDLDRSIEGKHVLVVEDIIDTGITLNYLKELLEARQPASVEIAALLDKPERRQIPVGVKYVGFKIPDEFVVGYGLDADEDYRYLPDICLVKE
jgi:hypoxanthine phosphoribosyltransferase